MAELLGVQGNAWSGTPLPRVFVASEIHHGAGTKPVIADARRIGGLAAIAEQRRLRRVFGAACISCPLLVHRYSTCRAG